MGSTSTVLPEKLLTIIRVMHDQSTAAICAYRKTSEEFAVTSGVRQGCVLALTLSNLFFNVAIRMAIDDHLEEERGVRIVFHPDAKFIGDRRKMTLETLVSDLEYADDMALMSNSWSDLEVMIKSLHQHCTAMGLTINCKKTKTLAVLPSSSCPQPQPILLSPSVDPVEPVSAFQYLGSTVCPKTVVTVVTVLRCHPGLSKASQAFGSLNQRLWLQKRIKTATKLCVLSSVIMPTLLSGVECTVLLEPEIHRIQSFVM